MRLIHLNLIKLRDQNPLWQFRSNHQIFLQRESYYLRKPFFFFLACPLIDRSNSHINLAIHQNSLNLLDFSQLI